MCGVTGLIGVPKDERVQRWSYQLAKSLLAETVSRGPHATGVYTYYPKEDGSPKLFCYKLAAPAPDYVKTKYWRQLGDKAMFLLLGHCRFYTNGTPEDHKNNHPHLSDDNKMALIHNGIIGGFSGLKKNYPCKSDCDSEVILRIIESEEDTLEGILKLHRLMGTSDSFACLLGKWDPVEKVAHLWCFRDTCRPLCYVDLREEWGQYHFASTPEIMEKALSKAGLPKAVQKVKAIEIPTEEIWHTRSDTMEWEVTKVPSSVPVSTGYTNPSRNYERATNLDPEDADKARVKALIDAIVENCTEIDDNLRLSDLSTYGGIKGLEDRLKEVAFDLEKIVNPEVDGDLVEVTDQEYFD